MLIKVKVTADARAEKVVQKSDDLLLVSVRQSAERNQANKRVLELLRALYPGKLIKIVHGQRSPGKIVEVK
jgi:uncharacterized protein YggU (UPF0235/DUF167 family)